MWPFGNLSVENSVTKMETPKGHKVVNSGGRSVVYELPLRESGANFNLEKAVCSHGFFMTAPNQWDPVSKTLRRPLRLLHSEDRNGVSSSSSSVTVKISQPPHSSHLLIRVYGTDSLSPAHQQSLMEQVRRMLRLSEKEEKSVREFQEIYGEAKASGFGRIFRSPTLFEDMVKCILVCNCQWSRTLSMARALCELQLELQCPMATEGDKCTSPTTQFSPKTPAGKEASKRKIKSQEKSRKVAKSCASTMEADAVLRVEIDTELNQKPDSCVEIQEAIFPYFVNELADDHSGIGNFPSPKEVANLDANFLKKRCNLGYRANRIVGLAQSVVEGRIQLGQLEQDLSLSNYINLNEQLGKINGFGPFTCANVLMCMGFYHVIPSDSETIRHLNQVHGKKSTIKSIQHDIEMIYTKYSPFQFLVYWSEIWSFYEEKFGKLSELPNSSYKLITAANMRGHSLKSVAAMAVAAPNEAPKKPDVCANEAPRILEPEFLY